MQEKKKQAQREFSSISGYILEEALGIE